MSKTQFWTLFFYHPLERKLQLLMNPVNFFLLKASLSDSKVCKNSTEISRPLPLKLQPYMIAYRPDPTIPGAYVLTLVILV